MPFAGLTALTLCTADPARSGLIRSRIQTLTALASSSDPHHGSGPPLDASSEATHLVRARSFLRADPHFVAGLRYTQEFQAMHPVRARSFLRADPHHGSGPLLDASSEATHLVRARSFLRADPHHGSGPLLDASSEATHLVRARSFLRADPHHGSGPLSDASSEATHLVRARSFLRAAPRHTVVYACVASFSPPRDHFECNSVLKLRYLSKYWSPLFETNDNERILTKIIQTVYQPLPITTNRKPGLGEKPGGPNETAKGTRCKSYCNFLMTPGNLKPLPSTSLFSRFQTNPVTGTEWFWSWWMMTKTIVF